MGDFFKPFVDAVKGIHPLTAGLVAAFLWVLMGVLIYQSTSGADVSTRLVIANSAVAFPAALVLTIQAIDGLVRRILAGHGQRRTLKKHRQIIRDLTEVHKNFLWSCLANSNALISSSSSSESSWFSRLIDLEILEWAGVHERYHISNDYWDLLVEEGWELLYEGREQPSNDPPEWARK